MGLLGSPVHDSSEALVSRPGSTRWTALPGHRNSNDQQVAPALPPPPSQLDTVVKPAVGDGRAGARSGGSVDQVGLFDIAVGEPAPGKETHRKAKAACTAGSGRPVEQRLARHPPSPRPATPTTRR